MEWRIEDLATEDLANLLRARGDELSDDEAEAVQDFVARVGGIENALLAIEMLTRIDRAA